MIHIVQFRVLLEDGLRIDAHKLRYMMLHECEWLTSVTFLQAYMPLRSTFGHAVQQKHS